jgi:hypothetical protein
MKDALPRHLYRFVSIAWGALLLGLFLALGARAISPAVSIFRVGPDGQEGQLTVYNLAPGGGVYGLPVEMGDYDGDGAPDLAIAPMAAASGPDGARQRGGEVYVYKGNRTLGGVIDRAKLGPAERGLTVWGARADDFLGTELYSRDVDGDGIEDLLISAQNYDGPAGDRENCGGAFIILGAKDLLAGSRTIDLASPPPGVITIFGAEPGERLGIWIEAGDLDGDGFGDILIGADQYPPSPDDPRQHAGKVYVIYGRSVFPDVIDLATFSDGASVIIGRDAEDHLGACLHARDLDADGYDELIIGAGLNRLSASQRAPSQYPPHGRGAGDGPDNGRENAGEVYVLFGLGGARLPPFIDLAGPLPGELEGKLTTIYGAYLNGYAGEELTSGDFNGDGYPDLVIGALASQSPEGRSQAGVAHILYWRPGLEGLTIDLHPDAAGSLPEGLAVSMLYGRDPSDILGDTLSAADFDNDGFDDLAVGIPHADLDGKENVGAVAVVFGRPEPFPPQWAPEADELPERLRVAFVIGRDPLDLLSYSMEARDYDLDGYADLFPNAMRGDGGGNAAPDAGEAYVISGFHLSGARLHVSGVEPPSGPRDQSTPVVVSGSGFTVTQETRLFLGELEVAGVEVISGRRLAAVFPPGEASGRLPVTVMNRYGSARLESAFHYENGAVYVRGDATRDGRVDISDAIRILGALFLGSALPCLDAADTNDDGQLNITDAIYLLGFLFLGGPEPPPPFPGEGEDPTPDALDCAS